MSEIISIVNQKGGVGKTTTAYNLASALRRYNKKTLLIDMDPQGNCSMALGIDPTLARKTISDVMSGDIDIRRATRKTTLDLVSLVPSNLSLALLESTLYKKGLEVDNCMLKKAIDERTRRYFDFIIIDCPPSLGFLSLNALVASDSVIIPVQCEYFAMNAISSLLTTIFNLQREENKDLDVLGIFLTMFDPRTNMATEIAQEVRSNFKEKVFTTIIPRSVVFAEASMNGVPVNEYKPTSQASLAYASLAREVMESVEKKNKTHSS